MTDGHGGRDELTRLALEARNGDEEAFRLLVLGSYRKILRWAVVRTGDPDDAEDVAQEVLVRLYQGLRDFGGRASIETWLYRVTANQASSLGARRSRDRRARDRLAREAASGAAAAGAPRPIQPTGRRVSELVRRFLRELPARQREAFDLVDLQGLTATEAAGRMEVQAATVRVHLLRARRRMRELMMARVPEIRGGER